MVRWTIHHERTGAEAVGRSGVEDFAGWLAVRAEDDRCNRRSRTPLEHGLSRAGTGAIVYGSFALGHFVTSRPGRSYPPPARLNRKRRERVLMRSVLADSKNGGGGGIRTPVPWRCFSGFYACSRSIWVSSPCTQSDTLTGGPADRLISPSADRHHGGPARKSAPIRRPRACRLRASLDLVQLGSERIGVIGT